MSEMTLSIPTRMECDCCGSAIEATWEVRATALGKRRCPDAAAASKALTEKATEAAWLVRGTAALCPECLAEAVENGDAALPPPASAAQAIDQLALARAVRKLRKGAGRDGSDL